MADDTALLSWIDVDGKAWNLSDPETYYVTSPGLTGAYGVPTDLVSYVVPLRAGDFEQYVRIAPNEIRLPLLIRGNTYAEVERQRRALSEAMRPTRGPGVLRHTAADGITRDLYCREIGRMRDVAATGPSSVKVGLVFRAADPYWYDSEYTTFLLKAIQPTEFFFDPTPPPGFFPIRLGPTGVSGAFAVENVGQAETWPIFVITGPGTNPTLTNTTTGEELTLTITLTGGQYVIIDTNPATSTVERENGTNQWATVSDTSTLWPLAPGANMIELAMGSTTTASALQVLFKARWEGV